ncbi:MAG: trigger factor [Anaerolineales bacterium]
MKIEREFLEDHQVKIKVEVDDEVMEGAKRRAARKIAKRVKIPGFRPGKAPYQVIVRQVGEAGIVEEAVDQVIEDVYPQAIEEAEIDPYGPGTLENVATLDPPTFEIIVPLKPEVILGNYGDIRRPYELPKVTNKDVDDVIDNIRESRAIIKTIERPAEEGDIVTLQLSAEQLDGKEIQDNIVLSERTIPFIIRTDVETTEDDTGAGDDEWPYSGFTRQLVGLSTGDEKTVSHSFHEDDENETFRGIDAKFRLVVESVQSRDLPELDDNFVSENTGFPDYKSFRADIFTKLESRNLDEYNNAYDDGILEEAVGQAEFKYPPQALDREVEHVIKNLKNQLKEQNLDIDLYMKTRDIDNDGLREEAMPVAETRLKQSLFLFEFAKAENIEVDDELVKNEAKNTMDILSQSLSQREARKLSSLNVINNLELNVKSDMISRLAIERLREISSGKIDQQLETNLPPSPEEDDNGTSNEFEDSKETNPDMEIGKEDISEIED